MATSGPAYIAGVMRTMIAALVPTVLPDQPFRLLPLQRPLDEGGVMTDFEALRGVAVVPQPDPVWDDRMWNADAGIARQTFHVWLRYRLPREGLGAYSVHDLVAEDAAHIALHLSRRLWYPDAPSVTGIEQQGAATTTTDAAGAVTARLDILITHAMGGED